MNKENSEGVEPIPRKQYFMIILCYLSLPLL